MVDYALISQTDDLGEMVRTTRKKYGLSQTELAKRSNTSQRFVSEFERGKQTAEIGKVLQLLKALGLKLCAIDVRTPEENRALIQDLVERVAKDLQGPRAKHPHKKLADFLAEGVGVDV